MVVVPVAGLPHGMHQRSERLILAIEARDEPGETRERAIGLAVGCALLEVDADFLAGGLAARSARRTASQPTNQAAIRRKRGHQNARASGKSSSGLNRSAPSRSNSASASGGNASAKRCVKSPIAL